MKKMMIVAFLSALMFSGCVNPDVAVAYAQRAHPECTNHHKISHNYGGEKGSQTEVAMTCGKVNRSITVKCNFGWGVISDTTCHENN